MKIRVTLLLLWAIGFWPVLLGIEYLLKQAGHAALFGNSDTQVIFVIYLFGLFEWLKDKDEKKDEEAEEEPGDPIPPEPNMFLVIDAPKGLNPPPKFTRIQGSIFCSSPPKDGARLVIEEYLCGTNVIGRIISTAACVSPTPNTPPQWKAWVALENPEQYALLCNSCEHDENWIGYGEQPNTEH